MLKYNTGSMKNVIFYSKSAKNESVNFGSKLMHNLNSSVWVTVVVTSKNELKGTLAVGNQWCIFSS